MALKWGIAAAGLISSDFVTALKVLPKSSHEVVAVAARGLERAQEFAKQHNIPNAYQGYEKLGQDPNIEVVYVAVLNPQHYEVVKMMLEYGKHVLCEKPLAMNERQAKKLTELAKEKKLFLMEGIWSRCFPAYKELRKIIDSGQIGEVLQVSSEFGVPIIARDRIKMKSLGGGALLALGVYNLQLQQFVFKGMDPTKILATAHMNADGIDNCISAIITYPSNKTALMSASTLQKLSCEAVISGTKGIVRLPKFWCPTKIIINDEVTDYPLIENNGTFNFTNCAGLAYEADEVKKCLRSGKLESDVMTHSDSLILAKLTDQVRAGAGVVFPSDSEPVV